MSSEPATTKESGLKKAGQWIKKNSDTSVGIVGGLGFGFFTADMNKPFTGLFTKNSLSFNQQPALNAIFIGITAAFFLIAALEYAMRGPKAAAAGKKRQQPLLSSSLSDGDTPQTPNQLSQSRYARGANVIGGLASLGVGFDGVATMAGLDKTGPFAGLSPHNQLLTTGLVFAAAALFLLASWVNKPRPAHEKPSGKAEASTAGGRGQTLRGGGGGQGE